jgi:regulator of nucleoside diphosphate kinase
MASSVKIRISRMDRECLTRLVRRRSASDDVQRANLIKIREILDSAAVADSVPKNAVALGSKVLLRNMESGRNSSYTLVLPAQADIGEGMISILAPLGLAMWGRSAGEVFQFDAPGGTRVFRIEKVLFQAGSPRSGTGPAAA